MAINRGKQFEDKFREDVKKSIRDASIDRLPDQMSGWKGSTNICDFVVYKKPYIAYIECKVVEKGNTFNLKRLSQLNKLAEKRGIPGVILGVVIWFVEKEKVVFVPYFTFEKLIHDDKKSFHINMIGSTEYNNLDVRSIKRRIFLDSDYSEIFKEEWAY